MITFERVMCHEMSHIVFQVFFGGETEFAIVVDLRREGLVGASKTPELPSLEDRGEQLLAGGLGEARWDPPGNGVDWAIDAALSLPSILSVCQPFDQAKKVAIHLKNTRDGKTLLRTWDVGDLFGEDATRFHNLIPGATSDEKSAIIVRAIEKVNRSDFWNAIQAGVAHAMALPLIDPADPAYGAVTSDLTDFFRGDVLKAYRLVNGEDMQAIRARIEGMLGKENKAESK